LVLEGNDGTVWRQSQTYDRLLSRQAWFANSLVELFVYYIQAIIE
jgi:hypothetical protein